MTLLFIIYVINNYFFRYRYFKILETSIQLAEGTEHTHDFLTYKIKLKTKCPLNRLFFDELWIDDRLFRIRVAEENDGHVNNLSLKNLVLFLHVESEEKRLVRILPMNTSFSGIMLAYRIDNMRKYCPVPPVSKKVPFMKAA